MAQGTQYSVDPINSKHDLRDKAVEQFDKVAVQVEGAVKSITERGREAGEEVQAVASHMKSAVDTSVREQPMATLAVAAALGFILGAIWKS